MRRLPSQIQFRVVPKAVPYEIVAVAELVLGVVELGSELQLTTCGFEV